MRATATPTANGAHRLTAGRVDAAEEDPQGRMPAETLSAAAQIASFASKGLGVKELVALSGAHTVSQQGGGREGASGAAGGGARIASWTGQGRGGTPSP